MFGTEVAKLSFKVTMIKESNKVLYAEVGSDFADILFSFLTLPLGTIVRLLSGNNAPFLGSLSSLYTGLQNVGSSCFWTDEGKQMLLRPRHSSGIQCRRLKLKIDDTPAIQYFMCPNSKCVSMYYEMKCPCSIFTSKQVTRKDLEIEAQSGGESVFTVQTASFLLTDDLQILPNKSVSLFRILKLNGIDDTNVLEERTVFVGLKEIKELLKRSLVSKTPITDIVLSISSAAADLNKFSASIKYELDALSQAQSNKIFSASKKIPVKVLVQKSTNRLLLAQTDQDFVDFIFSLLTIPLGRVRYLLGNDACFGSINNLYKSLTNLENEKYMKSRETITRLLEPQFPPYYLSCYQIFNINQPSTPNLYWEEESNKVTFLVAYYPSPNSVLNVIDPKGEKSFVKGPATFIVTDDLVVSTQPSTSIISTLNQMKIPVSDVEEHELGIGMEEALSLLKASLTSTCALTDGLKPFLKRQPKQEK